MKKTLRNSLYKIIFEADTKEGKSFDIMLLIIIILSVIAVILESIPRIENLYSKELRITEWIITGIFTFEYLIRIYVVDRPRKYMLSFYGIIDFLSIIPTYLTLIFAGAHGLMVIRAIRLLRVFRIFKLTRYISEGKVILRALKASRAKISVFLFAILMIVLIIGTLMYLIEGGPNGFTSIPKGIYWAIVTLTTVGYGDIAPQTALGQAIASFVMILGYAIIAVPTGIVTSEFAKEAKKITPQACPGCLKEGHEPDATFCKFCGTQLT